MKKFVILAILFLLPLVSAINLEMKSEFDQGETLLLKFSGNFQNTISKSNIAFYRDHVPIPMDYEFMREGNDYYVYALLKNKNPRNYSVALENARYYKQGSIVEDTISKNFTITESFVDFSIKPGFIKTIEDFEIELQNFQDTEITIDINSEMVTSNATAQSEPGEQGILDLLTGDVIFNFEGTSSIVLYPGEIKRITFELGEVPEPTLETISFSTANQDYEFPVYIYSRIEEEKDYSVSLNFEPSELKISLYPNLTKEETVVLKNVGDEVLENITFELSNNLEPYINISKTNVYNLAVNASTEILLLFASVDIEQTIQGELTARIPNETEDLSITFEMLTEGSVSREIDEETGEEIIGETEEGIPIISKGCEDLDGTIFEEPQECLGETRFASDGNCCIGELETPVESSTGLVVGWAIIMIIIIALVWFFKFKYKAGRGEVDLFKISKGKK